MLRKIPLLAIVLLIVGFAKGQLKTNTTILQKAQTEVAAQEKSLKERILKLSAEKGWPLSIKGKNGQLAFLLDIDLLGYPIYVSTTNNLLSATTIRTNQLWTGGSTGLNLDGSATNVRSKLALWDGGRVRSTHLELTGRILHKDNPLSMSDHSTHVAGTLMASGVNPNAKGMAHGLQQLVVYDFTNHMSEMLGESPNILASNHSYSTIAGWFFNVDQNRWEFHGQAGATEDYKFGYYSADAQLWDSIAYNAPNYLIVKAAGNNRGENGPAVGQPYFRFNAGGQMTSAGNRPSTISNNDSYDIIPTYGVAKNVLTIGAIEPITQGYARPEDVVLTGFSDWGPTDDGRIKPDVVADGSNVLSSTSTADNAYDIFSGTSMASPAAAGSVLLLQEYYSRLHAGAFMRSATLKGIVIHTADEAGPSPGPDYQHGWGLINMVKAASVITADNNNADQRILENTLNNGANFTQNIVASGKGPLMVTICWTDPKGDVDNANLLNNTAKKLVNDLDIRVTRGATTYMPWILNPANRPAAATTGDNSLDNVEKIVITDAVPGETYTITVTHKGTLARGQQAYSVIMSGVGGVAYCASAATSTAGTRIDSVSISNVRNKNPLGCTTYTNYNNLAIQAQPGQSLPFYVGVGSCDASTANKIVKIFIDYNNDGDFADAGENVAESAVINGTGSYTGNIVIPGTVVVGNSAIMRIVVQETTNAASVVSCGTYSNGETQDYRVQFGTPSNDAAIVEIISPFTDLCAIGEQYLTVKIRNLGSSQQSNIPITATVKNGATTIANLSFTYPLVIQPFATTDYTFQTPFPTIAGQPYTITARTNLANDQNPGNDTKEETIAMGASSPALTGAVAEQCGANQVFFRATTGDFDMPFWYATANATTPLAIGDTTSTTTITPDKTYYVGLNDGPLKAGPVNRQAFPQGSYNAFNGNFVRFNNTVPLIIETARLYIANAGKITFTVADIVNFNNQTGAYSYFPISATTVNVYPTKPNPQAGDVPLDAADTGAIYRLDLVVPFTGDHAIIVQCEDGANIFRNNNITVNPYPVGIPGLFTITGNSAINTQNTNDLTYFQRFYYFFYDVRLRLANCASPRTAVVATTAVAPTITLNGNVFTSSAALGNNWYRNGVQIPGASGSSYTATQGGTYKVIATDGFGCSLESNTIDFTPTAVVDVDGNEIALAVTPNPNRGEFNLQFEVKQKRDLQIDMINVLGQKVYQQAQKGFIGKYSQEIRLGKLLPGTYFLKIQHGNSIYVKKILIR